MQPAKTASAASRDRPVTASSTPSPEQPPGSGATSRSAAKRRGVLLMVGSSALLAVGDAAAKWLSTSYPIGEIIFLRGLIILTLLLITRPHRLYELIPRRLGPQLRRAFFFVASTYLMLWALSLLPLPTVGAISFTAPIIMTALAPVMLGETVGWARWLAVLAGFCGVLLIVDPIGATWSLALLVPLGAAVAQALRDITTREVAETETAASVVFVTVGATVLAGALSAPFGWIDPIAWGWTGPSIVHCGLLVLLGLAHGTAYLMQVGAFRDAEAAFLAPFKYSFLIWAIVVSFLVWGHIPSLTVVVGAAIIAACGIAIWYREAGPSRKRA